ncbi:YheC/YheD family endospore coat-associated protein [Natronincola ferrireducens]|uniref:YheC/D like ATP-grasp n=1 Tax=Natronincola ferrireducens TaxID=393762 RepID=A0A1G9E9X2_9FIRM|nr:YheC/YheD family protein [Natronincola ferrireducens]SDK72960.1 YheC/D like ATP-grasp [Natronincola ferrireducens]
MKYIGILLDNIVYRGIPYGKTGYENLSFYEDAAKLYGLIPCFFTLKDITPDMNEIKAYVRDDLGSYKKKNIPIPRVIHNRGLYFSKKHQSHLQSLVKKGFILFNQWNRYRKLEIYHTLTKYDELTENLPETRKATKDNIRLMENKYSKLILKPDSGSLGNGLMKIEDYDHKKLLTIFSHREKNWLRIPFTKDLPEMLKKRISSGNYIVQEYIPLVLYKGNPFDMRVSCQKNHLGEWQMTGVVGKVAKDESFITNVAKGGTVYQLGELLHHTLLDEKKVTARIEQVSLKISKILEEHFSGLADIGLDLGITTEGIPKFIECNGRDLRYSFRNANMHDIWKNTYATPIGYGKFLMDRG